MEYRMDKANQKEKGILLEFLTIVTVLLISVFAVIFLNSQTDAMTKGLIESAAKDNEYTVQVMADRLAASASDSKSAAEIIASSTPSGTRYWFLYSADTCLFEKNAEVTSALGGLTFSQIKDSYVRSGGRGIDTYMSLLSAGNNFTAVTLKDSTVGSELISVKFITIGGEVYALGVSVLQSYLLSTAHMGERIYLLRILTVALCLIVTGVTAYFALSTRKKSIQIRALKYDLMNKNVLVQDQGEKLFESQAGDNDLTEDALTGLYNAEFFKTFLEKLSTRNVRDTGFILVRIENLNEITFESGYAFSSRLLSDTASGFLKFAGEKDLCARTGRNEFVMVKINTTGKSTWDTARNLLKELKDSNPQARFVSGSALQNPDMSVDAAYESARKGMA